MVLLISVDSRTKPTPFHSCMFFATFMASWYVHHTASLAPARCMNVGLAQRNKRCCGFTSSGEMKCRHTDPCIAEDTCFSDLGTMSKLARAAFSYLSAAFSYLIELDGPFDFCRQQDQAHSITFMYDFCDFHGILVSASYGISSTC